MIIHAWMHWFWITTAYFEGSLFFTTQTMPVSYFSVPAFAEAGLLNGDAPLPNVSDSSQTAVADASFLPRPVNVVEDAGVGLPRTTRQRSSSSSSSSSYCPPTSSARESIPESEETALDSVGDRGDARDGIGPDGVGHPLKKFSKYSHLKYGKVKSKGTGDEEAIDEFRKTETVKLVKESSSANASVLADAVTAERSQEEMENGFDGNASEGTTREVPTSDGPGFKPTTLGPSVAEEASGNVLRGEPPGIENGTETPSKSALEVQTRATEDRGEVHVSKNDTLVIENKVEEPGIRTTAEPFFVENRVAAATSAHNYEVDQAGLNAGSITGITLGILVVFSLFGAVSFVLYRRRYLNKPQVLHDKCSNLDSSGYIDETSLRENSEEMYSLDNDSFLNSLEAMTIQNYWTESVKHTKL